jgi:hypothetical protein
MQRASRGWPRLRCQPRQGLRSILNGSFARKQRRRSVLSPSESRDSAASSSSPIPVSAPTIAQSVPSRPSVASVPCQSREPG